MRIRIGRWEVIVRRRPPGGKVLSLGQRQQSLGKKKVATSGRNAL